MSISVAPIVLVFCVRPFISGVGVTAVGLPEPSNPITWVFVPVIYVSTPLESVMIALLAVSPVLVPHTVLSLVLVSVLIDVVFPDINEARLSVTVFIEPDMVARVKICASVILKFAYVDSFATTVSISVSCPAVGVGIDVSCGIFRGLFSIGIILDGLQE